MDELTEEMLDKLNDELDSFGCGFFFVLASTGIAHSMLKNSTMLEHYILYIDAGLVRYINDWFSKQGFNIKWNNTNSSFWIIEKG